MIALRHAHERGHADHGWLDSFHTFSFADYYDPAHMGVSALRVINDDTVAPAAGFATHGHRDMEIISYVLDGALEHKDSMGNGSVIRPGEVQRMSAGTGVRHSEFNASKDSPVHFLQIWIIPNALGVEPGYEQKNFAAELDGRLRLVASPDGQDGSLTIHQDARLYASRLRSGQSVSFDSHAGKVQYVHLARGQAELNGTTLAGGDGATVKSEAAIAIHALQDSEVLLFDLPA